MTHLKCFHFVIESVTREYINLPGCCCITAVHTTRQGENDK